MKGHVCLVWALWAMLWSWPTYSAEPSAPRRIRLVMLVCFDDLKPALGCYGDLNAKTPHLDRVAARGIKFTRAYCNQAVCAPSRNALLTGLRPQTLGVYDLGTHFRHAAPDATTLPQYLRRFGWRAESLGKIFHVGHGNHDDEPSWSVPSWKTSVVAYALPESRAPQGLTREEALFSNRPANNLPRGAAWEQADVADDAYPDGQLAAEVIRRLHRLAARPEDKVFMAVGFVKPHLPFAAPRKYWDLYDQLMLPVAGHQAPPQGAPKYAPQFGGELRQYRDIPESGPIPESLQRMLIHGYYAAVSYVDAQFGKILQALEQHHLLEETLLVVWGDHGWHLGDHGIWCKHTNYEQATRIPLIVSGPGVAVGKTASTFVETVDIYPTLCEWLGLPVPNTLDGRSFAHVLRHPELPHRDHVIHVYPRQVAGRGTVLGRAVRTDQYRLVEWKSLTQEDDHPEWELYDYVRDPLETRNLAHDHGALLSELRALLDRHPLPRPPVTMPNTSRSNQRDRETLFRNKDKNGDGVLSEEEFLANQPDPSEAPKRFRRFDVNGDGKLSRDEFVHQGRL
ncbi:MAG: iduronate-2-sulfatase [Planctomycetaceae bacterium]|nr:MAG: iduronate-2-sulfatase [Planctomycetaceae bacterium]